MGLQQRDIPVRDGVLVLQARSRVEVCMKYLRAANWDKWQSYRSDRGTPPWIKVHRNLMTNPEWIMLSDSEKGVLVSLWIVCADRAGLLPADAHVLRKVAQLDEEPNLNKFIELGFFETDGRHDDAKLTPSAQPDDVPEERRGEEKECANAQFEEFWNLYPRKVDKKRSRARWEKLGDSEREAAIVDVKRRNAIGPTWGKEKIDFVLHPSTYLNGENWNDELPTQSAVGSDWGEVL